MIFKLIILNVVGVSASYLLLFEDMEQIDRELFINWLLVTAMWLMLNLASFRLGNFG